SSVHPGDTIWLRGGTYVGVFSSVLTGTAAAPIQLRAYPGERATLDGSASTTLTTAVNATTTTMTFANGFYAPGTSGVRIDSEDIFFFVQTGASTYTVVRGWNGTSAASHGAGAAVTTRYTTLLIHGAYTWYMGLEIMNSGGMRSSTVPGSIPPHGLGFAIDDYGPGTKLINNVIHDTGQGMGVWSAATDAEVYGNLVYYNGWDAPDRGHGHGVYLQNQAPSTKQMTDNILHDQFAMGSQAYTESDFIDNISETGNTAFNNGSLSQTEGYTDNLLIGGLVVAHTPSMINNYTYAPHSVSGHNNLGYQWGCTNATVTGNYFISVTALKLVNCTSGLSMTGNTFYDNISGFSTN